MQEKITCRALTRSLMRWLVVRKPLPGDTDSRAVYLVRRFLIERNLKLIYTNDLVSRHKLKEAERERERAIVK